MQDFSPPELLDSEDEGILAQIGHEPSVTLLKFSHGTSMRVTFSTKMTEAGDEVKDNGRYQQKQAFREIEADQTTQNLCTPY